jgi:prevent-host-death family protein
MTKFVGVHEAKTHLSRLLEDVAAGEEIAITRRGVEVARLVRSAPPVVRQFGTDEGVFTVPDDFNNPLEPDLQAYFE